MVKRGAKLKDALHRYQGKDVKRELQRKSEKAAEKKRKTKHTLEQEEEDIEAEEQAGGVPLNGDLEGFDSELEGQSEGSEEWETDDEDEDEDEDEKEEEQAFNLSRLDDSDSESEDEDDDEDKPHNVNLILPTIATTKKEPITTSTKSGGIVAAAKPTEEEDIPLSDLSDVSDTQDIIPHQRLTINNHPALQRALASFSLPLTKLPFSEHQSVTTKEPVQIEDVEDELNRELSFYSQALSSASSARALLRKEGVPFSRPNDFFAEMVKSDEHMGKIKAKLVNEAANKKAAQDARKQRDLKKFGKQVQQEKLKERAKEKREMLDKVKLLKRKRQSSGVEEANEDNMFDVALEDAATTAQRAKDEKKARMNARGANGQPPAKSAKRQQKDEKFGFGGKKKHKKSGDAMSSADMRDFSTKRMKAGGGAKKSAPNRPGKSRRAKMK